MLWINHYYSLIVYHGKYLCVKTTANFVNYSEISEPFIDF